jgi:hypothetical protein
MRFKLYREYGALNSKPVFDAFSQGIRHYGHTEVAVNEDIAVIWSVLWRGRMKPNQQIYESAIKNNKPVIIIEVGNLNRGTTWRVSLNNINSNGCFGNDNNLDPARPAKLKINLKLPVQNRRDDILICSQLPDSLQWQGMPSVEKWVSNTIAEVRKHTDRKIVVRPHPRHVFYGKFPNATLEIPKAVPNTYDSFNINYNYHCVVNHNSGPAVQAAINGTPVICDQSSLAWPVSNLLENIENLQLPDRDDWFLNLCHTEWHLDEIAKGVPLGRLLPKIIL